jgi:hypothetical protein
MCFKGREGKPRFRKAAFYGTAKGGRPPTLEKNQKIDILLTK